MRVQDCHSRVAVPGRAVAGIPAQGSRRAHQPKSTAFGGLGCFTSMCTYSPFNDRFVQGV
jgi:hypothetical protein